MLEKAKIKLTMMGDFNLIDAFRIFDVEDQGSVTAKQLQDGLNQFLGSYIMIGDIHLFMRVFDKDQDGRLKYSEFCDAFLPLDTSYAGKLAQKPPQEKFRNLDTFSRDPYTLQKMKEEMFVSETKSCFVEVWKTHVMIC